VDHGLYIQVGYEHISGSDLAELQDCLYGVHKAMEVGLLDLATFDKEAYRFFERVEYVTLYFKRAWSYVGGEGEKEAQRQGKA